MSPKGLNKFEFLFHFFSLRSAIFKLVIIVIYKVVKYQFSILNWFLFYLYSR